MTDLKVKCKAIKFLEYNIGENLDDLRNDNDFSDITKEWVMK